MSERAATDRPHTQRRIAAGLARRRRQERLFRLAGTCAAGFGIAFLGFIFVTLFVKGATAFSQTHIRLDVTFSPEYLAPQGSLDLFEADTEALVRAALRDHFPGVEGRADLRQLYRLVSVGAGYQLRDMLAAEPELLGQARSVWVPAAADVDMLVKGRIDPAIDETLRPLSDAQLAWIGELRAAERLERRFNHALLSSGDSSEPELAGIKGALVGSFYMLLVTLAVAFPIGVAAAFYLEEFAPRNRWTDLIEVNINNLAAVPSIIFGLLGLAVFIDIMGLPRSASLVGGLVLSLMTLPVIIIASRAAITAIPQSIRDAALALGASRMQVIFHHLLPASMPGIMTGTILGMSRALGETAPLLMIGMVAFIADIPQGPFDPATALPVQVFLWADQPERAFEERTSAAIIVLLGFLVLMNLAAIITRKRLEKRW
jgi:phosphate transport system permease protein